VRKAVIVLATAAVALNGIALPSPAEARGGFWRGGFGPAIAGGLIIGGLASSAYAWGPGYGYYGAYGPRYYGPYAVPGYAAPYGYPYYYDTSRFGGQPQGNPYPY
jgi:hypothetical protein